MKAQIVKRLILEGQELGPVQGMFFDQLFTARGVMLYATRPGLVLCLPWLCADLGPAGLALVAPFLSCARIEAHTLLWMREMARTPTGARFREALFHHLQGGSAGRWVMPAQRRAYGSVRPLQNDVSQVNVEVHTHPAGCPGFSPTDDADDYGLNLQLVIEDIDGPSPVVYARAVVYGRHIDIPATMVAALPDQWRDGHDDGLVSLHEVAYEA